MSSAASRRLFLEPCFLVQALEDYLACPCCRFEEFAQVRTEEKLKLIKPVEEQLQFVVHEQARWCPRSTFVLEEEAWREFDASSNVSLHVTAYNAESDTAYNADSDGMDDNCPSVDVNEDKASIHLLRKHKKLWCREKGVIDCLLVEQEQSDSARGWNSEEDARSEESSWEQRSTSSEIAHGSRHDSDEIAYDSRHDKDAADGVIENIDDESLGLIIDGLQVVDSDPEASCVSEDQSDALLAVRGSGPEEQEESIKQS